MALFRLELPETTPRRRDPQPSHRNDAPAEACDAPLVAFPRAARPTSGAIRAASRYFWHGLAIFATYTATCWLHPAVPADPGEGCVGRPAMGPRNQARRLSDDGPSRRSEHGYSRGEATNGAPATPGKLGPEACLSSAFRPTISGFAVWAGSLE